MKLLILAGSATRSTPPRSRAREQVQPAGGGLGIDGFEGFEEALRAAPEGKAAESLRQRGVNGRCVDFAEKVGWKVAAAPEGVRVRRERLARQFGGRRLCLKCVRCVSGPGACVV